MRILLATPLLLLGACDVDRDSANNTVSVTVNEEVAGNAVEDAGNQIGNIASDIGNDVRDTAEKVDNRLDNTDVDIDTNTQDNRN